MIFKSDTNSVVPTNHKSILTELSTKLAVKANRFYREGQIDSLTEEANEPENKSLSFEESLHVLAALKSRNLEPALNWISANTERLKHLGSYFEVKCRNLQFMDILENQCQDVIKNSRTHLSPIASLHMNKMLKSPHAYLMDPSNWEKLAEEFTDTFCDLAKQTYNDPMNASVGARVEGESIIRTSSYEMGGCSEKVSIDEDIDNLKAAFDNMSDDEKRELKRKLPILVSWAEG